MAQEKEQQEKPGWRNWWIIAAIAIPTFLVTVIGFAHAVSSLSDWKDQEPGWLAEGQAFGEKHSARECVTETIKREQSCEEIVCANLIRSFALACLKAAPRDEALCQTVPISPSGRRYSAWAKKVCKAEGYEEDVGCRSGLVGVMESCHPIAHNNYFPNILDESQRDKSLWDIFLAIFQK